MNEIKNQMLNYNLASEQIDELFELDGILHIAIKSNPDTYLILDCWDDYVSWWIENKADDDCFMIEYDYNHEDGSSSVDRILDSSINVLNIPDFEEYVRHITGQKILKVQEEDWHVEIDLERLLHTYTIVKLYNRHKVPQDLLIAFDKVVNAHKYLSKYNSINLN